MVGPLGKGSKALGVLRCVEIEPAFSHDPGMFLVEVQYAARRAHCDDNYGCGEDDDEL